MAVSYIFLGPDNSVQIVEYSDPLERNAWMRIEEAAEFLGMPQKTLYNEACAGKLHPSCAVKRGRCWYFNRKILKEKHLVYKDSCK